MGEREFGQPRDTTEWGYLREVEEPFEFDGGGPDGSAVGPVEVDCGVCLVGRSDVIARFVAPFLILAAASVPAVLLSAPVGVVAGAWAGGLLIATTFVLPIPRRARPIHPSAGRFGRKG
jgi:hypothetical protein